MPTRVFLSIQISSLNGVPVLLFITAYGAVPDRWLLESSTNLQTWTPMAQGTNVAVEFLMPFSHLPMQFFRLLSQ